VETCRTVRFIKLPRPDQHHEARFGANVLINPLSVLRVLQAAMSRLHTTSTAKSISGAMTKPAIHFASGCQRRRLFLSWLRGSNDFCVGPRTVE